MKRIKRKLISCALAFVIAFTVSVSFNRYAPVTAHAASEQFLSEVALVYENSVDDAKAAIAGTDWKLFEKDLNKGADPLFQNGVYLIYKTTDNVEEAITDLRVMDMYGGFSTSNYQSQLEESRKDYLEMASYIRTIAAEFASLYAANDDMAKLAYRQMNYYKDVQTENGTETNMLMGEFFLNLPTDEKIVQVLMEGNAIAVSNLVSLLAVGVSGASGATLATRVKEKYEIKDTLTHEEYYDTAYALSTILQTTRAKLLRYDTLSAQYNLTDDSITDEEYTFMANYGSLALIMDSIYYGEMSFADFIRKGDWETNELYPFVAALTKAQKALIEMGQLDILLQYSSASKPINELIEAVEELEADLKNEEGVIQVIDVYTGVDRSVFKGTFAMTNAAERQQALTGKTWNMDSAYEEAARLLITSNILACISAVECVVALGLSIKVIVLNVAKEAAGNAFLHGTGTLEALWNAEQAYEKFAAKWTPVAQGLAVTAIALAIIAFGLRSVSTWYNYYNPNYLEIPNTIVDVRETDLGDKYIKYTAAKVLNGEDGQENADFNAYEGLEWNALYYTKDANAGNCLTPNFLYRENNNTVSKRHQGVSMFGEDKAYNLNSHVYEGGAVGIYLSVRYSTTKKAASNMPSVIGSIMASGGYYAITGIGGMCVGFGCFALLQKYKLKKRDDIDEVSEEN